jgi:hypothetical protein
MAYRLVPGTNIVPLADPGASIMKRAGFITNHLWVTPFDPAERYAAGDYPNQHPGGDGLPRYTAADRSLERTDLVSGMSSAATTSSAPRIGRSCRRNMWVLIAAMRVLRRQPRARPGTVLLRSVVRSVRRTIAILAQ